MAYLIDQPVSLLDKTRESSSLDQLDGVCLFGGYDSAFLPWLEQKKERVLIVIEEDEIAFLRAKVSPLAEHSQIHFFCYKKDCETLFRQIAWECVFLRIGYALKEGASKESAKECFALIEHYHQGVDLLASEYKELGLPILSNVLNNLSLLPRSKRGLSLEGVCRGMTAIVCGAGPSLNAVAPLLSQAQDHALIIAGGSAIEALERQGVRPHLLAAVDPSPSLPCFLRQENAETPFFYQSRFSHALLSCVQGSLVWMPSQSLIPLESYMLGECGLFSEPFDAGWTVANFCTALAVHLGCTTILFAGVDFVCDKKEVYASGLCGEQQQASLVPLHQAHLCSRKDWLMSAEWTRTFVKKHSCIQWSTLTTPALDLLGVPLLSFEQWLHQQARPQEDMRARVHSLIVEAEDSLVTLLQIQDVKKKVQMSFEASLKHCEALLSLWERMYPQSPLELPAYCLRQQDLEQEICYEQCLAPLWEVWKYSLLRTEHHPLGRELHKVLFFKNVIETYLPCLRSS